MNIRAFLRNVLMNLEITNLTADKDVFFLHANGATPPYVEYEVYDSDGALYAEGKEVSTDYFVQVDIFSKGDYTDLEGKIKEKMLNAGFEGGHGPDLYEQDTGLFHKAMRFNFTTKTE